MTRCVACGFPMEPITRAEEYGERAASGLCRACETEVMDAEREDWNTRQDFEAQR